ncbi:hypothetical protein [Streptomyces sp. SYSU K217416]
MHPDTHLRLHALRAEELRREAARYHRPATRRRALRTQVGWTMIELGLRLVQLPSRPAHA